MMIDQMNEIILLKFGGVSDGLFGRPEYMVDVFSITSGIRCCRDWQVGSSCSLDYLALALVPVVTKKGWKSDHKKSQISNFKKFGKILEFFIVVLLISMANFIRRYFPHEGGHRGESRLYCPRTK